MYGIYESHLTVIQLLVYHSSINAKCGPLRRRPAATQYSQERPEKTWVVLPALACRAKSLPEERRWWESGRSVWAQLLVRRWPEAAVHRQSPLQPPDETGARTCQRRHWCWVLELWVPLSRLQQGR